MGYLNLHTHRLDRGKSLADLTAEIRAVNVTNGWRSAAGGPGDNTFGDYAALLHTEVAEMTEAYRDWKLNDATAGSIAYRPCERLHGTHSYCDEHEIVKRTTPKPEGVGSELADTVIRLIDMCDVFGTAVFDMDIQLADVAPFDLEELSTTAGLTTFGDWTDWLHGQVVDFRRGKINASHLLRDLVTFADKYGIDLPSEVERKIAYNRTRPHQHGGRTLSGATTGA